MIICCFQLFFTDDVEASSLHFGDGIIIVCEFQDKKVMQNDTIHVEIKVINLHNYDIYLPSITWNFDWFNDFYGYPSRGINNDTWYYYTHAVQLDFNTTIIQNHYGIYYLDIEVDTDVPVGIHEYHFECTYANAKIMDGDATGGIPFKHWESQFFNDFEILEIDSDNDGVPDSQDKFPNDHTEFSDQDNDGIGDNSDLFPQNRFEWKDSDYDGVGDNSDVFPYDPNEWCDSDRDGYGDNRDSFPLNNTEWNDTDNDLIGDNSDAFPFNPSASVDSDNDGHPDMWNIGYDENNSTTGLKIDHYPNDPERWKSEKVKLIYILTIIMTILFIVLISINIRLMMIIRNYKRN